MSERTLIRFCACKVAVLAALCLGMFTLIGCGPSEAEIARKEAKEKAEVERREAKEKADADRAKAAKDHQTVISQVRTTLAGLEGQLDENGLFKQAEVVTESDPWGKPIIVTYRKNSEMSVTLLVRSSGPDGLPNNADDVYAQKTRFHKNATKEQIEAVTRSLTKGLTGGVADGITGKK